jgi:hypothetical protein
VIRLLGECLGKNRAKTSVATWQHSGFGLDGRSAIERAGLSDTKKAVQQIPCHDACVGVAPKVRWA